MLATTSRPRLRNGRQQAGSYTGACSTRRAGYNPPLSARNAWPSTHSVAPHPNPSQPCTPYGRRGRGARIPFCRSSTRRAGYNPPLSARNAWPSTHSLRCPSPQPLSALHSLRSPWERGSDSFLSLPATQGGLSARHFPQAQRESRRFEARPRHGELKPHRATTATSGSPRRSQLAGDHFEAPLRKRSPASWLLHRRRAEHAPDTHSIRPRREIPVAIRLS